MTRNQFRAAVGLLLLGYFGSFWWFFPTFSADLMAVWLAGKMLAMGQPDQVYAGVTEYFYMYPPEAWRPYMQAEYEYTGPIYPFIYPPLWAKMAELVAGANFWVVTVYALFLNAGLQMLIVWLAWRAARPAWLSPQLFMGLAVFFMLGTHIGTISLQQNQPQVFVSFLLVLTIERARHNADIAAGLALALAASIKLYPALFAIYWVATGNWRAVSSFVVFGASLAAVSVAWAGWPMHVLFLEQVSLISNSVLMTAISFNLDASLAQLFYLDQLNWIVALEAEFLELEPDEEPPGWYSMVRPTYWKVGSGLLLVGVFAASVWLFVKSDHDTRHAIVWPMGITAVAIFSPLTWAYYFIPSVAFAPIIIDRLGPWRGSILWISTIILIFGPFVDIYRFTERWEDVDVFVYQWAGFVSFFLMVYAFWQSARVPRRREDS